MQLYAFVEHFILEPFKKSGRLPFFPYIATVMQAKLRYKQT